MSRLLIISTVIFALMCSGVALAADRDVCPTCTYTTIQSAINAAVDGDQVRVTQGTYPENLVINGKDITLAGGWSADFSTQILDPSLTVVDAGGSYRVLKMIWEADITVKNITLQNGTDTWGGCVSANTGDEQPMNITFEDVVVQDCVCTAGHGGGISISPYGADMSVRFTNLVVRDCVNTHSNSAGGGMYLGSSTDDEPEPDVPGNLEVVIVNSLIYDNVAGREGGGIAIWAQEGSSTDCTIVNSTITDNTSNETAWSFGGGGVAITDDYETDTTVVLEMYNTILYGNTAAYGADLTINMGGTASHADVYYCDLNIVNHMGGTYNTGNNITPVDPAFIDPDNGDYRLRSSSGCKDVGDNTHPEVPAYDFEGDDRIIDTTVDIGADEVSVLTTCVSNETELVNALDAADGNSTGDVIMVGQGTYTGNFTYSSTAGKNLGISLLGGYTSGCTTRVIDPSNTTLDGDASGRALSLESNTTDNATVEGFTITNGASSGHGGGIYVYFNGGDITLSDNIITGNTATSYGGGAFVQSYVGSGTAGTIRLTNNTVTGNSCSGFYGGGVFANTSSSTGAGGTIVFDNNVISGNSADTGGGGVRATALGTSSSGGVTFTNNTIAGNTSNGKAGVYIDATVGSGAGGPVTLTNNTITGNDSSSGRGGGLEIMMDDNINNIYNNIIWGNTASTAGDDIYLCSTGTANGYNNVYTELSGSGWTNSGDNQVGVDPLLIDNGYWDSGNWVDGDYHLSSGSPCIDAGTNAAFALRPVDFEGDDRIIDGDNDDTDTVDIGADEYVPVEEMIILHKDGALWSTDTGWTLTSPPYYAGSDYARDLEFSSGDNYLILHKDGALYDSGVGWTMTAPPYYAGSNYAVDLEVTATDADCILDRDGALWYSDTGWVLTSPPYYSASDYARALELRADTSYVILHQYGGLYDSASGWVLTSPPYYAGSAWVVDMKLEAGGYVLLHQDGALWSTSGGWVLTSPPYYAGSDYARALEMVGTDYVILHKDGALYDSVNGWNMASPPYYPGSNYAVDLEVQ